MACEDDPNVTAVNDALVKAVAKPAFFSVDGMTTEQHRLAYLVEAAKYVNGRCVVRSPRRGLRFTKLVKPNAE
jgi:acyl dehydratase